ncbi:MAG: type II toxin-antitoxin system PemK/MazF family toxin [Varibaculum cambriense]|uniref:type II toxin-antitoxin system PemK/MazF family toxin n=1 Tax=Varibaculum cambriense TaxID=184870 RepID=UPI00241E4171|nr:type II toxin-antitoxin system PemK/MazF family toxin [Varibaculum cambriense]MBS6619035.1 type II toxin-antitoxin system PemK/MazF family toxin [Varibaculum cambriense]
MRIPFRKLTRMISLLGGNQLEQATSHPNRRRQQQKYVRPAGRARYLNKGDNIPPFAYDPDTGNGAADPGEVIWCWVPYEEEDGRGKDRPVLVMAALADAVIGSQLTSKDHDKDAEQEARWGRYWMDIGAGAWDSKGRESEARLDRLLLIPRREVRREGARLDRERFNQVAAAIRKQQRLK